MGEETGVALADDAAWTNYLDAARRKIEIASFHANALDDFLKRGETPNDGRPPIAVQASFEGVVIAVVAAIDQVAQAVNSALGLRLPPADLFQGASREIEARVPEFKEWRENPLGIDLRRVRTRMMHYSYRKTAAAPTWDVEVGTVDFKGLRDLSSYAKAAVTYAGALKALVEKVEKNLHVKK